MDKTTLDLPCRKECGKTLDNVHNRNQHEKVCTGTFQITCGKCNLPFNTLGALQKHMPFHQKREKSNIHQCHLCKHVFLTNQNLTAHLDKCEASHICKLCEKSFSSKSSLERHFGMCSKSKFACLFCDYRCILYAQLADYTKRNHAKKPTFSCSQCNNVIIFMGQMTSYCPTCRCVIPIYLSRCIVWWECHKYFLFT